MNRESLNGESPAIENNQLSLSLYSSLILYYLFTLSCFYLQAYSSKYDTFIGLSHSTQLQVLRDFVVDCAPTECQCAAQHSPCATLHSSFGFPVNMNVFYEDLNHNHNTLVQILCSWPSTIDSSFFSDIMNIKMSQSSSIHIGGPNEDRLYVAAIEDNMKVVLLKGIMDAIASVNILGVRLVVKYLLYLLT